MGGGGGSSPNVGYWRHFWTASFTFLSITEKWNITLFSDNFNFSSRWRFFPTFFISKFSAVYKRHGISDLHLGTLDPERTGYCTFKWKNTHQHTHTHTPPHPHTHTPTPTHTLPHTHTHINTHTPAHPHTHTLPHTHTSTPTHPHTPHLLSHHSQVTNHFNGRRA